MYKIVKFDFEKLEKGMEVYHVIKKWLTVDRVLVLKDLFTCAGVGTYYKRNGKEYDHQNVSFCAMKVKIKVEDIPTKEFGSGSFNYYCFKEYKKWKYTAIHCKEIYGTKYYTEENAELVCKLLNEEEK